MVTGKYFCEQCSNILPINKFCSYRKEYVKILLLKKLNAIIVVKALIVAIYENI